MLTNTIRPVNSQAVQTFNYSPIDSPSGDQQVIYLEPTQLEQINDLKDTQSKSKTINWPKLITGWLGATALCLGLQFVVSHQVGQRHIRSQINKEDKEPFIALALDSGRAEEGYTKNKDGSTNAFYNLESKKLEEGERSLMFLGLDPSTLTKEELKKLESGMGTKINSEFSNWPEIKISPDGKVIGLKNNLTNFIKVSRVGDQQIWKSVKQLFGLQSKETKSKNQASYWVNTATDLATTAAISLIP